MALREVLTNFALPLLLLSTLCTAAPSPISDDSVSTSDAVGSYRAEVAALKYIHFTRTEKYFYGFITNEYAGNTLVRQSFCDQNSIPLDQLAGSELACQDVTNLGLEMIERDYTFDDFDRLHMAQVSYLLKLRMMIKKTAPVMVVIDSVASGGEFTFHVQSGSESEKINSNQINAIPDEFFYSIQYDRRTGLWQTRKEIEPYQYSEE